jgi:hypothetical protein
MSVVVDIGRDNVIGRPLAVYDVTSAAQITFSIVHQNINIANLGSIMATKSNVQVAITVQVSGCDNIGVELNLVNSRLPKETFSVAKVNCDESVGNVIAILVACYHIQLAIGIEVCHMQIAPAQTRIKGAYGLERIGEGAVPVVREYIEMLSSAH